jgi:hypothetical protein
MRTPPAAALTAVVLAALVARPGAAQDASKTPAPPDWIYPQDVKCAGRRLTLHEPQVLAFDEASNRVSLRFPTLLVDPLGRSSYGMAEVSGALHVDLTSRLMRLDMLSAGASAFPGAPAADAKAVADALSDSLPKFMTLRLELLVGRPGAYKPPAEQPKFATTAPAILVRHKPAVLVHVDGEPVMLDVETFPLQYLANSASDVFRDAKTDLWYLLVDGAWMQAKALAGPWKRADAGVPSIMSQIPTTHPRGHIRKFVPGTPEFMKRGMVAPPKEWPEVIIADKPTELVLLAGDPLLTFVPGLRLQSVANTESDLFLHLKTNLYYLLLDGRWFSSEELDGPWTDVPQLPEEFAKIPRDHVRGHVVWCVPGTPEASEACALASIEERATLNKYAPVQVLLEGKAPETAPLEGDVKYVVNTEDDCFVVGGASYVCQRGVWYRSEDGKGSWKACTDLPPALAKLSENTVAYHATFCRPLGIEGETATYGVRGGYYGTYAFRGAPVYGNGVTRRGVMRNNNWYPCARTYGENRWYDPATGSFQARTLRPRADGTVSADDWSPYTASYGRVLHYGCRYDMGGRRMYPYSEEDGTPDFSQRRPDIYVKWLRELKKREGLDTTLFPFGDRSSETAPEGGRIAVDATGRVWRVGAKGVETFEKGAWAVDRQNPASPEVVAWLETLARIDARPATWKKWREARAAPIPINATVTPKTK